MILVRFKDYPHKIVNEIKSSVRVPAFNYYFGGREGGKVAGLKDFAAALEGNQHRLEKEFDRNVYFACPKTSVLQTSLFESYMDKNDLWKEVEKRLPEKELEAKFLRGSFTDKERETLKFILNDLNSGHIRPIVVRSSSLNEDAERASFAGIYRSVLLPNCHPDDEVRLRQFETAIKLVFASVFSDAAIKYRQRKNIPEGSERMAIALQNMVGRLWKLKDGSPIYHPELSFAAFSYNDYPIGGASPKEGVARIAFGLGEGVVENDAQTAVKVQLGRPLTIYEMYDAKQAAKVAPRYFYALEFKADEKMPAKEDSYLLKLPIEKHENEDMISRHRMFYYEDGFHYYPPRENSFAIGLFTFTNVIKGKFGNNLIKVIAFLNRLLQEYFGVYVDFEGAVDFIKRPDGNVATVIYVLQARPQVRGDLARVKKLPTIDESKVLMKLQGVIGKGRQEFGHLILVKREEFNHKTSYKLGQIIREMNSSLSLLEEEGKYLLVVPGRIGSRDPSLGIQCDFSHINHAVGIIELIEGDWVPSQGTHMFEAIVGAGMTLGHYRTEKFDAGKLEKFGELVHEKEGVLHYVFGKPMNLTVDEDGNGIIYQS
ncbi:MAG: PEP/pyruvate-binding domain-containing protein [Candidatus Micrarchaeota archaeon]|nr:PEP/pyruvate-binding domain-containing protein [Candidatus Micrarchaeota archaeon]